MKQNIGKWYTFTEYYDENGVQITKKEAKKNYIIGGKHINTEINGNTGIRKIWYTYQPLFTILLSNFSSSVNISGGSLTSISEPHTDANNPLDIIILLV